MSRFHSFSEFVYESERSLSEDQKKFLDTACEGKSSWEQGSDGKINITGDFDASSMDLKDLKGIKFGSVQGDFDIADNELKSLNGCPDKVSGFFNCSSNYLNSLEGGPASVKKAYYCSNNNLFSLDHIAQDFESLFADGNDLSSLGKLPKEVKGDFYISYNETLKSLEGSPEIIGQDFICSDCSLETLEGGPKTVKGFFNCSNNKLENLDGGPEIVRGVYDCSRNMISSLNGIAKGVKILRANGNKISSLSGLSPSEAKSILKHRFTNNLMPEEMLNYQLDYLKDKGKIDGWLKEYIETNPRRIPKIFNIMDRPANREKLDALNLFEFSFDNPGVLASITEHIIPGSLLDNYIKENLKKFSSEFQELFGVSSDLKDLGF
jgi:hypothetical protein